MNRLIRFAKNYYLFAGALGATALALVLYFCKLHTLAYWVLGAAAIAEVLPLLWGMGQDLRDGRYGVDILAATAIVTSVIMKQYWAGIVIVLMLTGGEALEDYAEHRAKTELDALLSRAPQTAHLIKGRKVVEVRASEVNEGDKLIIKPGEVVPVDAVVVEGSSSFDESSLTGESVPQEKSVDGQILSGSVNIEGAVTVKALRAAADSQYEQIIRLVRAASNSQAPFVRLADRYSIPFTVVSFGIAIVAWVLSHQSIRFLEVLVVATPCPLILAAPIAIISGMSRASKHGIIIKTGSSLEKLAEAKTFAFDKTGTLTNGKPKVNGIVTFEKYKKADVLALAAGLEQNSNHVLAQAIVAKAEQDNVKPVKAKHVKEISGKGLEAHVSGKDVLVGRLRLLQDAGVVLHRTFEPKKIDHTAAFIAVDRHLAGYISFADESRPESKRTLQQLKALGIQKLLMVTGDNATTARAVARKLGITKVESEALPGDKLKAVEAISERPVAFVGDGVNDAPVLTAADVGIALGARGSTAASESADIVIMQDDIEHVAQALAISKRTFFIAKQSIFTGIGLSVALMVIFASGAFKPIYGAAIQELVDVVVIFNALRAHGSFTSNTKKATPTAAQPQRSSAQ
jgi:heavy metal translocating P-type ATPase